MIKAISQERLMLAAKVSLAALWIFTGLTSLFFSPQTGYQVLAQGGIIGLSADVAVYAGALLDIVIGLWLLTGIKPYLCCLVQLAVILVYSILLSFIDAGFWLHPFGPLTKNLPVMVLILMVMNGENKP
ncbi:DoxX-like family protein [Thalassomonas actiniarum]|uniref:DoxX-like family protein n=1 Tax=Thalassomonas actiniarum TaxID=485447 RepID=UPI0005CEA8FE|nr:DoxX-like family protein [Thalassomonas actiniarum]